VAPVVHQLRLWRNGRRTVLRRQRETMPVRFRPSAPNCPVTHLARRARCLRAERDSISLRGANLVPACSAVR
jgi:hypothetical protein